MIFFATAMTRPRRAMCGGGTQGASAMSIVPLSLSIRAVTLSTLCLAALAPSSSLAQTFRGLGAAPGATGPVTITGISPDGSVAVGNSPGDQTGFTWTQAAGGTWT